MDMSEKMMTTREVETLETMSPDEAARFLGKSRPTIIALIRAGQLKASDESAPGSKRPFYRVTRDACVRWRESRQVQPSVSEPEPLRHGPVTGLLALRREKRAAKRDRQAAGHGRR